MRLIFIFAFTLILSFSAFAQSKTEMIVAANGQTYPVAGRDRQRGDNEIVVYAADFYAKKPTLKNGVDVYVVGGKVSVIQDRAGAVISQTNPIRARLRSAKTVSSSARTATRENGFSPTSKSAMRFQSAKPSSRN